MHFLRPLLRSDFLIIKNSFHTASRLCFLPKDEKDGHPPVYDRPPDLEVEKISEWESIKIGYKVFKEELTKFKGEIKKSFTEDKIRNIEENVADVIWSFNGDPKSLDNWVVTSDSDRQQGFSQAKLELTRDGKAIFYGTLNKDVPKDGKQKYAGYCNIRTIPQYKPFLRETYIDWSDYTHLAMRVRGDGRMYMITIGSKGQIDINWFDLYIYVLHTRGGPYWQYIKIPFSKFVLSNRGIIRDLQVPLELDKVSFFGITAADKINGPFKLEIDYIGVVHDEFEQEECAYETYDIQNVHF